MKGKTMTQNKNITNVKNASKASKDQQETKSIVKDLVEDTKEVEIAVVSTPGNTDLLVGLYITKDSDQNRTHVGDLIYRYNTKEIQLQSHAANFEAQVEGAILGDASIRDEETGQIIMISREEEPEQWIRKLYQSLEFSSNPFIATESQEYIN